MVEINIGLIEKAESGLGSSSDGWYYVKRKELPTLSDPANKWGVGLERKELLTLCLIRLIK